MTGGFDDACVCPKCGAGENWHTSDGHEVACRRCGMRHYRKKFGKDKFEPRISVKQLNAEFFETPQEHNSALSKSKKYSPCKEKGCGNIMILPRGVRTKYCNDCFKKRYPSHKRNDVEVVRS